MSPHRQAAGPAHRTRSREPAASTEPVGGGAGVWTITLWAGERRPLFVGWHRGKVALSPLGGLVEREWHAIARAFPDVTTDELAVLPDRVRVLVHVPPHRDRGSVRRVVLWFKTRVSRSARAAGLAGRRPVWERGYEGHPVLGAEEIALCRRRIRAGARVVSGRPTP